MTRWILVRHGQSVANVEQWFSGHTDVALTEAGREEARALAARLARERIVRVLSSDLQRAVDTARLALGERAHALRQLPALRERHLGAWTGRSVHELHLSGARAVMDRLDGRPPEGESLRDVARRASAALHALDDGAPTLVVSHGGLLRALLGLVDEDVHPERIGQRYVGNAAVAVRDLPAGAWGRVLARL